MAGAITMRAVRGGVRLDVRVVARGSRNAVEGVRDGALLVRVTAPPVGGAANAAVIQMIARTLAVPARHVTLVAGTRGRRKTVEIASVTEAHVRSHLSAILH